MILCRNFFILFLLFVDALACFPTKQSLQEQVSDEKENPKQMLTFIRHAKAAHNELFEAGRLYDGLNYHDPELTDKGIRQAQLRKLSLDKDTKQLFELVVASPMKRTLQTTYIIFGDKKEHLPVFVLDTVTEFTELESKALCDTGSHKAVLETLFPHFDFSTISDEWFKKYQAEYGHIRNLEPRINEFIEWIQKRPETSIAVVSHHGFLKGLLGVELNNCDTHTISTQELIDRRQGRLWSIN